MEGLKHGESNAENKDSANTIQTQVIYTQKCTANICENELESQYLFYNKSTGDA